MEDTNAESTANVEALEEGTLPHTESEPNQFCHPVSAQESAQQEIEELPAPEAATPELPTSPMERETAAVAMEEGTLPTMAVQMQVPPRNNGALVDTAVLLGDEEMSFSDTGYLVLRPGDCAKPPPHPQMAPNCCAVCLGDYEIGDTVVWSCNPECTHAYHLECIMEWLLKIQDGGTPCPCCKQEFTSWEKDRQERKVKWGAEHTFDVRSVSLR